MELARAAPVFRQPQTGDSRMAGVTLSLQPVGGAVGRGVVDQDDAVQRAGLAQQGAETLGEQVLTVIGDQDGGDSGGHGWRQRRSKAQSEEQRQNEDGPFFVGSFERVPANFTALHQSIRACSSSKLLNSSDLTGCFR